MFLDGSTVSLGGEDINAVEVPNGPPNQMPDAVDDVYATAEDNALVVSATGVLSNDSDGDGDPLTASLVSGASNGAVVLNSDGSFAYTPSANFNGADSFTYRANDGVSNSNTATVTITVSPVNDAPLAASQSVATNKDTPIGILLVGSDVDGDPLTYHVTSGPASGSLSGAAPNLTYTPNGGYIGTDSFTFKTNDGALDSSLAIVSITVSEVVSGPNLRHGVVSGVGETWTTVNLDHTYTSMVVIATPNYDISTSPGVVRIRNASGNSFDVRVDRAGPTAISGVAVHYVVVEEGVYDEPDYKLEAVKYTSTVTDENNSWTGQSRSYQQTYAAPVVVGQVMSYNDSDWSVFWASGSSRTTPPSSSTLTVGRHVGEDTDVTRADETIGYFVVETNASGTAKIEGLPYVAAVGSDSVKGVGDSPGYDYTYNAMPNSKAAVVSQAGMDGATAVGQYCTEPIRCLHRRARSRWPSMKANSRAMRGDTRLNKWPI